MNKKTFSLLEIIVVLLLSSFLVICSFKFINEIHLQQAYNHEIEIKKLELQSTKIFIERNIKNIDKELKYKNNTLFYKNSILLKEITKFDLKKSSNFIEIYIEIKEKIKQKWIFKI